MSGITSWIEKLPPPSVLTSMTWLPSKSTARIWLASNPFPLKFTRDVGGAESGLRKIDPRGVGIGVGIGVGMGVGFGVGIGVGHGVGMGLGLAVGLGLGLGLGVGVGHARVKGG